jgi:hypothetical protein
MILTVGTTGLDRDQLVSILTETNATLVDVRSKPYGRVTPGFGRQTLTELLGARYQWRGDLLGGFPGTRPTPDSLNELARDFSNRNAVLMCQCGELAWSDIKTQEVVRCHRLSLIATPLLASRIMVWHLALGIGKVIPTPEAERWATSRGEYDFRSEPVEKVLSHLKRSTKTMALPKH